MAISKMQRIEIEMRICLPYGKWRCADGREVLFNRYYQPMWHRLPGEQASAADPAERVQKKSEEWFYTDANPPHRNKETLARCEAILESGYSGRGRYAFARLG